MSFVNLDMIKLDLIMTKFRLDLTKIMSEQAKDWVPNIE